MGNLGGFTSWINRLIMAVKNVVAKVWNSSKNFDNTLDSRYPTGNKPPSAPVISAAQTGKTGINIGLVTPTAGASFYVIERSANGVDGWVSIAGGWSGAAPYSDTPLPANTRYWYRAYAVANSVASTPSAVVNAKTDPLQPPVAPAIALNGSISPNSVGVNLTGGSNITQLTPQRSLTGANSWTSYPAIAGNSTTYSFASLSPGVTYDFRMVASNVDGSDNSNVVSQTTSAGSGVINEGQGIYVTGVGFGSLGTITQESLGGYNNRIELAADDTLFTALNYPGWSESDPIVRVSSAQKLTRNKSLRLTYSPSTNAFGLVRRFNPYRAAMHIYDVYFDPLTQTQGQVKWTRHVGRAAIANPPSPEPSVHVDNRYPNVLYHDFRGGPGSYITIQTAGNYGAEPGFPNSCLIPFRRWVRIQEQWLFDTNPGDGNGSVQLRITDPVTGEVLGEGTISNRLMWGVGDEQYRYFVIQFYLGSHPSTPGFQTPGVSLFLDPDCMSYMNEGARAAPRYAIIGNSPTYSPTMRWTPQLATFYSDNRVEIGSVSKGVLASLNNGSAWVYLMAGINTPINTAGLVPQLL
jgi:hypothetical protein